MVLNYACELCNYETSKKGNYSRHMLSVKHKKKVAKVNNSINMAHFTASQNTLLHPIASQNTPNEKVEMSYMCEFCNLKCTRASSLNKHYNTCSKKVIIELKKKLKDAEMQIISLKETHLEDLGYYKKLIVDAGVGTKITNTQNTQNNTNNMSVQNMILSKHADAPALEMATPDILQIQLESENLNDNAELILYYYRRKDIAAFIGDGIVSTYKKKNPDDQSLWATDVSRLTMFIKKLMNGDESVWISDKKGVETREYLIDPLMDKVDEIMETYVKGKHAYIKMKKDIYPKLDDDLEYMSLATKLSNEIRHKKYHDDILRYIAPRFSYNKEKIEG